MAAERDIGGGRAHAAGASGREEVQARIPAACAFKAEAAFFVFEFLDTKISNTIENARSLFRLARRAPAQ